MPQRDDYPQNTKWLLAILLACLIAISACGSSSDKSPADDVPGTVPTMPGNPTAIIGLDTMQISWEASTDDGTVIGYDIIRNGVTITELLNATSFQDDMLEPDTTYQYSIIAVDGDGKRSDPSSVEFTTTGPTPDLPIINSSNHVELLRHVFDIYTGNAYFSAVAALPGWSDPTFGGLELPGESLAANVSITCLNGGTADFEWYAYGSRGFEKYLDFEFDNCQDDAVVFDGQLRRRDAAYRSDNNSVSSDGLSIDRQSQQIQFSGSVNEFSDVRRVQRSTNAAYYRVSDGQSIFELSDLNTSISYGFIEGISGGFNVRSDVTSFGSLTVEGELGRNEFPTSAPASAYDTGTLELVAEDTSRLVLNADNGDPNTVTIEITNLDGSSDTLIQPWSLWADHLKYEFELSDIFRWPSSRE